MRNFSTNEEAVANVTATLKAFNPKVLVMWVHTAQMLTSGRDRGAAVGC